MIVKKVEPKYIFDAKLIHEKENRYIIITKEKEVLFSYDEILEFHEFLSVFLNHFDYHIFEDKIKFSLSGATFLQSLNEQDILEKIKESFPKSLDFYAYLIKVLIN